jgi:WD40 repeat-containing protein SMU1
MQGIIKPNIKMDIFLDKVEDRIISEIDRFPCTIEKTVKYPDESRITNLVFSSNGVFFVTGSQDGIIEVWDSFT